MSFGVLGLDCDSLVIGAGLAGLVAALRLEGKTIVASAGMGATAISSGVLSSTSRDPEIDRWFLDLMRGTGCPYREGTGLTDLMAVKTGLVQELMDFGDEKPLPVLLDGTISSNARTLDIPVFKGRSCAEIAKIVDTDDLAPDLLATALKETGASAAIMPPVLGITRTNAIRTSIERQSGVRVFEYVTAPSVHGLRLLGALRGLAGSRQNITVLDTARIDGIDGIVRGHMGTKGMREFTVCASNVILATGGPLTGLRMVGDRVVEPLTGCVGGDADTGLNFRFLSDHPLMYRGIGEQPGMPGPFGALRAAGAVATGYGLYEALRTGYRAGFL